MTDEQTPDLHAPTTAAPGPAEEPAGSGMLSGGAPEVADEHPEVLVGAAFAGGLVVAMILKRLGH